jgi:hypothetical protein
MSFLFSVSVTLSLVKDRRAAGKKKFATKCNYLEIEQRNVSLSALNISQEAPINPNRFCRFGLSPPLWWAPIQPAF